MMSLEMENEQTCSIHVFFISNSFISKSVLNKTKTQAICSGWMNAKQFENFSSDPIDHENREAAIEK